MNSTLLKILAVLVIILVIQQEVVARPNVNNRVKRVSDPHFSDLETRVALHKINGIAITLPVAAGRDLDRIGRKRRSQSRILEALFNASEEDQGDPRGGPIESKDYEDLLYYKKK